jgi:hypothetical protein
MLYFGEHLHKNLVSLHFIIALFGYRVLAFSHTAL